MDTGKVPYMSKERFTGQALPFAACFEDDARKANFIDQEYTLFFSYTLNEEKQKLT